jgi:hypothetical protein
MMIEKSGLLSKSMKYALLRETENFALGNENPAQKILGK